MDFKLFINTNESIYYRFFLKIIKKLKGIINNKNQNFYIIFFIILNKSKKTNNSIIIKEYFSNFKYISANYFIILIHYL